MTSPLAPTHPTLRAAEPADWAYLDHLQRRHHRALGYLSRAALAEAIDRGRVLLALENGEPAGYIYGKARYQRREDVAIIFQAAVSYDARRRLLGTALVDAFVQSLAPSVKQMCLWCATDLDASLFWSALGFRAVASRDGAKRSGRTHALWCRHVHDAHGPFWVPESTRGGVMREARTVRLIDPTREYERPTGSVTSFATVRGHS